MSDNPPAFPLPNINQPGMTLRDWFAGQVMPSLLAGSSGLDQGTRAERQLAFLAVANVTYELADAMLEARKAKP